MWKWIGIVTLIVLATLIGAGFWGYRTLTAGGDSVAITIGASPERVFASLSNHDSLDAWWRTGRQSGAGEQHGPIAVGDMLPMEQSRNRRAPRVSWRASEIIPGRVLA